MFGIKKWLSKTFCSCTNPAKQVEPRITSNYVIHVEDVWLPNPYSSNPSVCIDTDRNNKEEELASFRHFIIKKESGKPRQDKQPHHEPEDEDFSFYPLLKQSDEQDPIPAMGFSLDSKTANQEDTDPEDEEDLFECVQVQIDIANRQKRYIEKEEEEHEDEESACSTELKIDQESSNQSRKEEIVEDEFSLLQKEILQNGRIKFDGRSRSRCISMDESENQAKKESIPKTVEDEFSLLQKEILQNGRIKFDGRRSTSRSISMDESVASSSARSSSRQQKKKVTFKIEDSCALSTRIRAAEILFSKISRALRFRNRADVKFTYRGILKKSCTQGNAAEPTLRTLLNPYSSNPSVCIDTDKNNKEEEVASFRHFIIKEESGKPQQDKQPHHEPEDEDFSFDSKTANQEDTDPEDEEDLLACVQEKYRGQRSHRRLTDPVMLHPECTNLKEPIQRSHRGRPKNKPPSSTKRDPSAWETSQKKASQGKSNRQSSKKRGKQTKPSTVSEQNSHRDGGEGSTEKSTCKQNIPTKSQWEKSTHATNQYTFPYPGVVPEFMLQYIENHKNVEGDGNCGFRVIAAFVYDDEEKWLRVRMDLMKELITHKELYKTRYALGCVEDYEKALKILDCHESPAPNECWYCAMRLGPLVATAYQRILTFWDPALLVTFLPLETRTVGQSSSRFMSMVRINGNHFISLNLSADSPLPPVSMFWKSSEDVKYFNEDIKAQLDKFRELIG